LDGREMGAGAGDQGHGAMTVRTRLISSDGTLSEEIELDARVCECCPTDMVALDDGTLVVSYRDRSPGEIRDIVVQRGRADDSTTWKRAQFLTADGWNISGCPVNGPSIDARGQRVALAWYTGAEARAHVRVAFSNRGVSRFGRSVDIEDVNAAGRVQIVYMEDGAAVVWMDVDAEIGSNWLLRWVSEDLELGETVILGEAYGDRRAGYPSLQLVGERLVCVFADAEFGGLQGVFLERR